MGCNLGGRPGCCPWEPFQRPVECAAATHRLRGSSCAAPAHPAASTAPAEALRVGYQVSGQPRAGGGPPRISGRALPGPPGRVVSAPDQPIWGLRAPSTPALVRPPPCTFPFVTYTPDHTPFPLHCREVWARVNAFPTTLTSRIKGSQTSTRR